MLWFLLISSASAYTLTQPFTIQYHAHVNNHGQTVDGSSATYADFQNYTLRGDPWTLVYEADKSGTSPCAYRSTQTYQGTAYHVWGKAKYNHTLLREGVSTAATVTDYFVPTLPFMGYDAPMWMVNGSCANGDPDETCCDTSYQVAPAEGTIDIDPMDVCDLVSGPLDAQPYQTHGCCRC